MQFSHASDERSKVWDMIKNIRTALFVTHDEDGGMHARPMAVNQQVFEGDLWFFTDVNSPKIEEIEANSSVLLAYAEPRDQEYISVTGTAEVVRDRKKIDELWTDALRLWFPRGPGDRSIALIKVSVSAAEYWDAPSARMVLAYSCEKAGTSGLTIDLGENKRVGF